MFCAQPGARRRATLDRDAAWRQDGHPLRDRGRGYGRRRPRWVTILGRMALC